jgi:hypothetical protein
MDHRSLGFVEPKAEEIHGWNSKPRTPCPVKNL